MQIIFKHRIVTNKMVLDALREFADEYPDTGSYDDWLRKGNYKYALRYGDRIYPPKHILSRVTGIPTTDFNGGKQTNRVLCQLGFKIEIK